MDALPSCSGDSLGSGYYERATQAIDRLQLLGTYGKRAALSVPKTRPKRPRCRVKTMSDNVELSDIGEGGPCPVLPTSKEAVRLCGS